MKKSTCDDLSVYMYTFTSESHKHCTRLSRRNEQLELSEEFDGGNRCVSTDELNKSSIVVDDGFFGTSATSCGIWCCCLSQYGKDMFFHWIWLMWHSGELIGEHLAYPQAWHSKVACLHHFTQLSLHISHDFSRLPSFVFHMFRISCQSHVFLRLFLKASRVDPTSTLKLHLGLWGLRPSVSQCVPVSRCVQGVPVCLSAMKLAAVCQDTATPRCPCDVLVILSKSAQTFAQIGRGGWWCSDWSWSSRLQWLGCANGQNAAWRIWSHTKLTQLSSIEMHVGASRAVFESNFVSIFAPRIWLLQLCWDGLVNSGKLL